MFFLSQYASHYRSLYHSFFLSFSLSLSLSLSLSFCLSISLSLSLSLSLFISLSVSHSHNILLYPYHPAFPISLIPESNDNSFYNKLPQVKDKGMVRKRSGLSCSPKVTPKLKMIQTSQIRMTAYLKRNKIAFARRSQ